jgi:hypothetical protein
VRGLSRIGGRTAAIVGGASDMNSRRVQGQQTRDVEREAPAEVRMHAERLVQESGSAELARKAIDKVQGDPQPAPCRDDLAKSLGFESYLALFEASSPLVAGDGKNWCVTPLPGGKWVAWNDTDLASGERFETREQAEASIGSVGRQPEPLSPKESHRIS